MGFEFTDKAANFFTRVGVQRREGAQSQTGKFENMLECYWLCCQIGIKQDEYLPTEEGREFVRDLKPMMSVALQIQGIGFYYHCKREGVSEEKELILNEMERFYHETSEIELGQPGYRLLNGFANGGFELLFDSVEGTYELSSLLIQIASMLSD